MPRAFRIYVTVLFVILTVLLVTVSSIRAVPITDLPEAPVTPAAFNTAMPEAAKVVPGIAIPSGPVHLYLRRGEQSRFELFFLDVKYGYDLSDFEFYNAWCLEKDKKIRTNALHQVRLYHHDDPDLPPKFKAMPWNQIHYLINHKEGSKTVIQDAIWYLADNQKRPISPETLELIEQAALKGRDFQPAEGELVAIICFSEGKQAVFIEVALPEAEEVEAFPNAYAPPPPAPELSFLPPWLPLLAIPMIPPFAILMSDDSSDASSHESPAPASITSSSLPSSSTSSSLPLSSTSSSLPLSTTPLKAPEGPPNPPAAIPEPSSVLLIGSGLAGLYAWGRIKRRG